MTNKKPSQAELAAALGLSPGRITALKRKGMPLFSIEAARAWRAQHIAPVPGTKTTASVGLAIPPSDIPAESFSAARTRREISEANQAEMAEAVLRGEYLLKADFERHLFTAGRMLRDTLTNCSRRIGAEVAGTTNPDECEAIIDREHRAALASFAQALRMSIGVAMADPSKAAS